jgi:hypothetical protein
LRSGKDNIAIIEITKELDKTFFRHIRRIAGHLRKCDYDELNVIEGRTPYEDVFLSCENSSRKWIIIKVEGNLFMPIAIFGVSDHGENGIPWMVATDGFKSVKHFVMRNIGKYLKMMGTPYKALVNYVDARNTDSIEWLKRAGFEFGETRMINKLPFYKFSMRCNNV